MPNARDVGNGRPVFRVRVSSFDSTRLLVDSTYGGCVAADSWAFLFRLADRARLTGAGVGVKKYGRLMIGDYSVRRIYRNGDVRVGCQLIKYLDIVRTMFAIEALAKINNAKVAL